MPFLLDGAVCANLLNGTLYGRIGHFRRLALSVQNQLNRLFTTANPAQKTGSYVAIRGETRAPIVKERGIWTVRLDGETVRNRLLGDLRAQLNDMGFWVEKGAQ